MSELLLLHILGGIALFAIIIARLIAVFGFRRRARKLLIAEIVTVLIQIISGGVMIMNGASLLHVCVTALVTIGFIAIAEVVMANYCRQWRYRKY